MVAAKFCLALVACLPAVAQEPARPVFEVASLKPSQSGEPERLTSNPGMWSCTNCRLFTLLGHAYKVFGYQISAPDWTKTSTFDVVAKLPPGVAPAAFAIPVDADPFALMMQALLTERFKMTVHREKKELPVYELVIAKDGHKLKEVSIPESAPPPGPAVDKDGFPNIPGGDGMRLLPDRGRIQFRSQAMTHVAHFISTQVDRPVLDMTGLKGRYALTLSWYRNTPANGEPAGRTIFEAIPNQLGLRLQPKKGPIDMVVIDRAEKTPIEN